MGWRLREFWSKVKVLMNFLGHGRLTLRVVNPVNSGKVSVYFLIL